MAKKRMINTNFWSDPFIQELKAEEKLLYLYLLTNERTSICGIYEITKKTMCFDTGLTENRLIQVIDKLTQEGKLRVYKDWYFLTNFEKHQQNNPSIQQGIERERKALPNGVIDRLGTECTQSGTLKPKLKLKLKPKDIYIKKKFLEFILLTEEEELKLKDKLGDLFDEYVERLNNYIGANGKNYKSHYHAILNWFNRDLQTNPNLLCQKKSSHQLDELPSL